jgi:hypothetical protein
MPNNTIMIVVHWNSSCLTASSHLQFCHVSSFLSIILPSSCSLHWTSLQVTALSASRLAPYMTTLHHYSAWKETMTEPKTVLASSCNHSYMPSRFRIALHICEWTRRVGKRLERRAGEVSMCTERGACTRAMDRLGLFSIKVLIQCCDTSCGIVENKVSEMVNLRFSQKWLWKVLCSGMWWRVFW